MNIDWKITEEDINKVKDIIEKQRNNAFVINRNKINIEKKGIDLSNEKIWHSLIQSLLTTQEKSGPGSPVLNLINEKPFPLSLKEINSKDNKQSFILNVLKEHRLHYYNNKADWISHNYSLMTPKYFEELIGNLNKLLITNDMLVERNTAHQIADRFKGLGPKQSRNFLQMQGLTKYVIPIDSRLTNWFNSNELFPFIIDSSSLSSINFYEFIEDGIQKLCKLAEVYPCILDACIFVSFNKGDYETEFN